jgi:hypothetical protein
VDSVAEKPTPQATKAHPDYEARIVQCARIVATVAHKGQVDKAGRPYILHPERVARAVKQAGGSDEAQAVAWLHDVLEDTDVTLDDLMTCAFSTEVCAAVAVLTRRKGEPAENYYAHINSNALAHYVKAFDIADNANPARLALIDDDETRVRLAAKYAKARKALDATTPPREPILLPAVGTACEHCREMVPSKNKQGRHYDCVVRARRTAANAWRGRNDKLRGQELADHRDAIKVAVVREERLP